MWKYLNRGLTYSIKYAIIYTYLRKGGKHVSKRKKPNKLETLKNIIAIVAGLLTIIARVYEILKG